MVIYLQVHIDDGFLNLLDDAGNEKNDVKMPENDIGDIINKLIEDGKEVCKWPGLIYSGNQKRRELIFSTAVTIQTAMGEEAAVAAKEAPK